jgi:hypothetical protein
MDNTATVVGQDVTIDTAKELLASYSDVKSLLDLAVRQDDPREWLESRIDAVCQTIAQARAFADNPAAKGLTLPKALGFGSESFAEICAAVVNARANNANLKSKAGKAGREIIRSRRS